MKATLLANIKKVKEICIIKMEAHIKENEIGIKGKEKGFSLQIMGVIF